jgi:putative DNA primase/helicase
MDTTAARVRKGMATELSAVADAALAAYDAGLCVIPARSDGTKAPGLKAWRHFQEERPPRTDVAGWMRTAKAFGVICGAVSGNLEMLELEGIAVRNGTALQFAEDVKAAGLGDLLARIGAGYKERTPSGGIHWLYRVDGEPVPGATKLARLADLHPLIETKGEGGFTVCAPSVGHQSGEPWRLEQGGAGSIVTITADEREELHRIARMLDQAPTTPARMVAAPTGAATDGDRPGDAYNRLVSWDDVLTSHGWTVVGRSGNVIRVRRPGKSWGCSGIAGTNKPGYADVFTCFSTSTVFDVDTSYDKFGAYATLEHHGDISAAASALAQEYGAPVKDWRDWVERASSANPDTAAVSEKPDNAPLLQYTDMGNAERFADKYRGLVRYVDEWGCWAVWGGGVWQREGRGAVSPGTVERAKAVTHDLERETETNQSKALASHAKSTGNHTKLSNMVRTAAGMPGIMAAPRDFNAHPWSFNVANGTIDLETGRLRTFDAADLCTLQSPVTFDPGARAPLWEAFLEQVQPDLLQRAYLQRLIGYSLVGLVREHILPVNIGTGANGKTTFTRAIAAIHGSYAGTARSEMLTETRVGRHDSTRWLLEGKRFIVASELTQGVLLDEAEVKELTGGDTISIRPLYEGARDVVPTWTIFLHTNDRPGVRGTDEAIWRRLRLVRWPLEIPEGERDTELGERLIEQEGPGILNWALAGTAEWCAHGLDEPESVMMSTNDYRAAEDRVGRFLADSGMTWGAALRVAVSDLTRARERWTEETGERLSPRKVNDELRRLGARNVQLRSVDFGRPTRYWEGVGVPLAR